MLSVRAIVKGTDTLLTDRVAFDVELFSEVDRFGAV